MDKKTLFVPSLYELEYLFITSFAVLTLALIVPALRQFDATNYHFIGDITGSFISRYLVKLNNPSLVKPITIIVWMIIGALVYLVLWMVITTFKTYGDDISPLHGLVVPRGYNRSREKHTIIARVVTRTLAVAGFIAWLVIFFGGTLPYCNAIFLTTLSHVSVLSFLKALFATVQVTVSLYTFIVLIRLVLLRKRIFS